MRSGVAVLLAVVVALGAVPAPAAAADPPTLVTLDGSPGEFISSGRDFRYTRDSAVISVTHHEGEIFVSVAGYQTWTGSFRAPEGQGRVEVGRYDHERAVAWGGEGHGCSEVGWFEVDDVAYSGSTIMRLSLRFEQRCADVGDAPLRGRVTWVAAQSAPRPPNPQPVPDGAWRPPARVSEGTGNVVYLESADGEPIVQGQTLLYRPNGDAWAVSRVNGVIEIDQSGAPYWSGAFAAPAVTDRLSEGYFGGVTRYPFDNPMTGGLSWSGDGRGCNRVWGWFALDELRVVAGELRAFSLRFAQRCERRDRPPLRGFVRWTASTPPPEQPFTDIRGTAHEEAIARMAAEGVISGYRDGRFRPGRSVTRGQVATFLVEAAGVPPAGEDAPTYSDIEDSPHRDAIRALAEWGAVSGYPDGTFRPGRRVTRGQMATFVNETFRFPELAEHSRFFADAVGTTHDRSIRGLIAGDITRPVGAGRFRPGARLTRGQAATLVARPARGFIPPLRRM